MAAEVHALVCTIDQGYFAQAALEELLSRRVETESFVESSALFNVIAENSSTAGRGLQIDVWALRENYKLGELRRIGQIPERKKAADVLAKEIISINTAMFLLMRTNKLVIKTIG